MSNKTYGCSSRENVMKILCVRDSISRCIWNIIIHNVFILQLFNIKYASLANILQNYIIVSVWHILIAYCHCDNQLIKFAMFTLYSYTSLFHRRLRSCMLYCSLSLIDVCGQEVFRANVKYYNNVLYIVGTKQ